MPGTSIYRSVYKRRTWDLLRGLGKSKVAHVVVVAAPYLLGSATNHKEREKHKQTTNVRRAEPIASKVKLRDFKLVTPALEPKGLMLRVTGSWQDWLSMHEAGRCSQSAQLSRTT